MDKSQLKSLESLNIKLNKHKTELFDQYARIFLEKNSRLNLISKNDEKFLFEKHVFDSLALNKFLGDKRNLTSYAGKSLLDIGTGGGFPSVPVSILYEDLEVYALDSIRKKIRAIDEIKEELNLKNLYPICERAENLKKRGGFDYVTSRAVAPVKSLLEYAAPHLKKGGYFIAYKSQKAEDELKMAQPQIKKCGLMLIDIIEYTLPLEEMFQRNLIVFQK